MRVSIYFKKSYLLFYLLALLVTNLEWAAKLAELDKPVGDGGDGADRERQNGAAVASQVKGLNGVSDQPFPALFLFLCSGGQVFAYVLIQRVILRYALKLLVQCMATVSASTSLMSVLELNKKNKG